MVTRQSAHNVFSYIDNNQEIQDEANAALQFEVILSVAMETGSMGI